MKKQHLTSVATLASVILVASVASAQTGPASGRAADIAKKTID